MSVTSYLSKFLNNRSLVGNFGNADCITKRMDSLRIIFRFVGFCTLKRKRRTFSRNGA